MYPNQWLLYKDARPQQQQRQQISLNNPKLTHFSLLLLYPMIIITLVGGLCDSNANHNYTYRYHRRRHTNEQSSPNNNHYQLPIGQNQRQHLTSRNLLWSRTTSESTTSSSTPAPPVPVPVPEFQEPIGNHTVAIGRDAQLSCKISKLGPYRTAWLRVEDKGILAIHNNTITRNYRIGLVTTDYDDGSSGFVLHIKNVQPSDRGGYMCQINSVPMKYAIGYLDVLTPPQFDLDASGAATTTMSHGGELEGLPDTRAFGGSPPAAAATASAQVSVAEGGNATLTCQASGHPTPVITWRREDGQSILMNGPDSDGVQKVEGQNSLALPKVHRLNAGAYLCIASNGVQPSASKRQVLDVKYSPTITVAQTDVGVALLNTASLPSSLLITNPQQQQQQLQLQQQQQQRALISCVVELNPLGTYHWFKLASSTSPMTPVSTIDINSRQQQWADDAALLESGDELSNSDKFEIVNKLLNSEKVQMQLFIRKLDRSDMAQYKCIAKNTIGHQSSTVRLYEVPASSSSRTSGLLVTNTGTEDMINGNNLNDQSMDPSSITLSSTLNHHQKGSNSNQRAHTRSSWLVHNNNNNNNNNRNNPTNSNGNGNRWQPSAQSSSPSSAQSNSIRSLISSDQVPKVQLLHLSIAIAVIASAMTSLRSRSTLLLLSSTSAPSYSR